MSLVTNQPPIVLSVFQIQGLNTLQHTEYLACLYLGISACCKLQCYHMVSDIMITCRSHGSPFSQFLSYSMTQLHNGYIICNQSSNKLNTPLSPISLTICKKSLRTLTQHRHLLNEKMLLKYLILSIFFSLKIFLMLYVLLVRLTDSIAVAIKYLNLTSLCLHNVISHYIYLYIYISVYKVESIFIHNKIAQGSYLICC